MEKLNQLSIFFLSSNLDECKIEIIIFLISIMLAYVFMHRRNQRNVKGPKSWPIIGATIELLMNFNRMHDWATDYFVESKTFVVRLPFITVTFIAESANVEHVLKTNFDNYPRGKAFQANMEELLGDGIFNSDGEIWRQHRKTTGLEFASRNLRNFGTIVFKDYALILSDILHQASIHNKEIDIQDLFFRMTLDSTCKVGFGAEIGSLANDLTDSGFAKAFDQATSTVSSRFENPFWRLQRFFNVGCEALFVQSIQVIDEFTYSLIHKRKAELQGAKSPDNNGDKEMHDMLSRLIELSEIPDSNLTDKSLRDGVINFLLAGRDSTASTLSWFIYMIMMNPNVAEKIYIELIAFEENQAKEMMAYDRTDPKSFTQKLTQFASLLNYDSLGKLSYLHATITETLRLYPAVPQVSNPLRQPDFQDFPKLIVMNSKGVLEDDVLPDGTKVRAGGLVNYVPYAMGRMVYNWGPDASLFNPDRWFNKEGLFESASPFKFTAFNAGPRTCLGKDSSYLQMKITLAILCRFFNFHLTPDHPVKYKMTIALSMDHGLKLTTTIKKCS